MPTRNYAVLSPSILINARTISHNLPSTRWDSFPLSKRKKKYLKCKATDIDIGRPRANDDGFGAQTNTNDRCVLLQRDDAAEKVCFFLVWFTASLDEGREISQQTSIHTHNHSLSAASDVHCTDLHARSF